MYRLMTLLIVLNISIILGSAFLAPLWIVFAKHVGGNVLVAGKAIAVFSVLIGLMTLLSARYEQAVRRDELFLVLSAVVILLSYVGYFFVHQPWHLYATQALHAVGCALQVPALFASYQRVIPTGKDTLAWGFWAGFYNIAFGTGALLGSLIAYYFGLQGVCWGMFLVSAVSLLLSCIAAHVCYRHRMAQVQVL